MHYLAVGGSDVSGYSGDLCYHWDLSTEDSAGAPTLTVLFTETNFDLQRPIVGINQELDVFVLGGSTFTPQGTTTYQSYVWESKLPILASTYPVDYFAQTTTLLAVDDTFEFGTGASVVPPQREGAGYGSWEGNDAIVFCGGAFIQPESILAYRDCYHMGLTTDQFTRVKSVLPGPTYFGVSEFVVDSPLTSLFIWGGRSNVVAPNVANTYNDHLYRIDFSKITNNDWSSPQITTCTLTGAPVKGTQYSSILEMHEVLYIFGGMNGMTGNTINPSQQFFSIDLLNNYKVTLLPMGANAPTSVWINPTLFTEATETYAYLYSGMREDGLTWNSPFAVSIFSINANGGQGAWLSPVEPNLSPYTSLPTQLPNIVRWSRHVPRRPAPDYRRGQ